MKREEIEALYMTTAEVMEYLDITDSRASQLAKAGQIVKLKGSVYDRASVETYKAKRGDKKGGRYPMNTGL